MTTVNGDSVASLKDVRHVCRLVEAQMRLVDLKHRQKFLESVFASSLDDWRTDQDLYDRLRNLDGVTFSLRGTTPYDRRGGQNYPLWQTEEELDRHRMRSRVLCKTNSYAKGLLKNLTNYCIGKGYGYQAASKELGPEADPGRAGEQDDGAVKLLVAQAQDFVDRFRKFNRWGRREREAFRRVWRDGEAFLRLFKRDDGTTLVRFVEPEQVTNPPEAKADEGWTFGIQHQMKPNEDVETALQYYCVYADGEGGEYVPAEQIVHIKEPDEDGNVKRGMPAFIYDALDALSRAAKLQRNLSIGAAIRAATAETWKFANATQSQISSLLNDLKEDTVTNPRTGRTDTTERIEPGTIRRMPAGQEPVAMPSSTGTGEQLQGVQGDLRQAASGFCAPEYLASADASNANFSSTKEAGTPFTKAAETDQDHFATAFLEVIMRALAWAVEQGLLSQEVLTLVEIQVQPPATITTDVLEVATADQIAVMTGWKSRRTCALERGLDPEQEEIANDEYEERHGTPGMGLPLPPELMPAAGFAQ